MFILAKTQWRLISNNNKITTYKLSSIRREFLKAIYSCIYILSFLIPNLIFSQINYNHDTLINKKLLYVDSAPIKTKFSIFDFNPYRSFSKSSFILPIQFDYRNNTNRPFGDNDGDFVQTNGTQIFLRTPVYFCSKYFDVLIDPMINTSYRKNYEISGSWGANYSNANLNLFKLKSTIRFKWKQLGLEIGNHNYTQGPANIDHLLMSKNAPGFNHLNIGTIQPVKLGFAHWELQLTSGILESTKGKFPLENYNLQNPTSINSTSNRYFSGLLLSFSPVFLKNNTFGLIRQFQMPELELHRINGFYNKYFPVLGEASKKSVGGLNEDKINRDQQLALFYRLQIPSIKSVISMEYGWNDHKWDMRDLLTSWPHSLAYIASFKKLFPKKYGYNDLVIEYVNMKQPIEYSVRDAGDWYVHGDGEGFTNQGQILGVGGSNGKGLNKLTVLYRLNTNRSVNTFRISQIKNDHSYNGQSIWNDWFFSYSRIQKMNKVCLRAELAFIHSRNFTFIPKKQMNSIQINISYIHQLFK